MPIETIVIVTGIIAAFMTFAVTLFWADRRTTRP